MSKNIETNQNKIKYYYDTLKHEDQLNQMFEQKNAYRDGVYLKEHVIITEGIMRTKTTDVYEVGSIKITKAAELKNSIFNIEIDYTQEGNNIAIFTPFYFEDLQKKYLFSPIYFIFSQTGNEKHFYAQIDSQNFNLFDADAVNQFNLDDTGMFDAHNLEEIENIIVELLGAGYETILSNVSASKVKGDSEAINIRFVNEFAFIIKEDKEIGNSILKGLLSFYKNELIDKEVKKRSVLDIILNRSEYDHSSMLYRTNNSKDSSLVMSKNDFIDLNKKHMGSMAADYGMTPSQRMSMLATDSDLKVIPVNGPPGTGKTELLKNILADYITRGVLEMEPGVTAAKDSVSEIRCFKPILGASSVNQAIINIIDGIDNSFWDADMHRLISLPDMIVGEEHFSVDDYYVPLISSTTKIVDGSRLMISLQGIYNYIRGIDADELKNEFIESYNDVYDSDFEDIYQIAAALYTKMKENVESLEDDIDIAINPPEINDTEREEQIIRNIKLAKKSLQTHATQIKSFQAKYTSGAIEYKKQLANKNPKDSILSKIKSVFDKKEPAISKEILLELKAKFIKARTDYNDTKQQILKWYAEYKEINDAKATSSENEITDDELDAMVELDMGPRMANFQYAMTILEVVFIHNLQQLGTAETSPMSNCPNCNSEIDETAKLYKCRNAKYAPDEKKWKGCNFRIFKNQYIWSDRETKLNPFSITRDELGVFLQKGYLNKGGRSVVMKRFGEEREIRVEVKGTPSYENFTIEKLDLITPLFPMVTSTMHSLYTNFSFQDPKNTEERINVEAEFFDLVLTDESGMILPSVALPAAYVAKKMVVVGDEKQIQPIFTIDRRIDRKYFEDNFQDIIDVLRNEHDDEDEILGAELCSRVSLFTNTLMSMSNSATYIKDPIMTDSELRLGELWLRDHFRCKDTIIKYCNYIIYKDILLPRKFEIEGEELLPLYDSNSYEDVMILDVDTIRHNNTSEVEANTIVEHIVNNYNLLMDEYDNRDLDTLIGIVTPFNNQASLIKKKLSMNGPKYQNITVGTVHKFQGSEREIIYFSPVVCSVNDEDHFINKDNGNMMNVAVSRAKHSFVVVGSVVGMRRVGGYTQAFVEYIEQEMYDQSVDKLIK